MSGLRVLIVGGYGSFGGRLAVLLADEPRLTLIIAGRSPRQAEQFCAALAARARLIPAGFDRDGDLDAQLAALMPDLVVDASGPFQAYGNSYALVRAALARSSDYLDLADGADFVQGIAQFDGAARERGIFLLAGASSFPVLTGAVVRRLAQDMTRIDAVSAGIAPSPFAGLGLNVIRAIASYCGKPIALTRDGRAAVGCGLIDSRRFTIAPPGRVPLGSRRFSLVDAPDLRLLPRRWPLRDVWTGAGTAPVTLHRGLNILAWMVRLRLLPSLAHFAPLMHWSTRRLSIGEHRGGMFVAIEGLDRQSAGVGRAWHMIAEGDDGPFIPAMACEAIIRRCLVGKRPPAGARAAIDDVELADYEQLFARRAIHTGIRATLSNALPLYRRLLGEAYDALPPPLQVMHELKGALSAEGRATVMRGSGLLARLAGALIGFPPAGDDVPVRVDFRRENGRERWTRTFAGRSFHSTQEQGHGRSDWLLCERFGALCAGIALVVEDGRLRLILRRWSLLGVPLPLWLAPRGDWHEHADDGRFHFHVEITHPFTGLIVHYRGWLVPHA